MEFIQNLSWGSISIIEVIWTLIALYGLPIAYGSYHRAKGTAEVVSHSDQFGELDIITASIVATARRIIMLCMLMFVFIGLIAMSRTRIDKSVTDFLITLSYSSFFIGLEFYMIMESRKLTRNERLVREITHRPPPESSGFEDMELVRAKDVRSEDEILRKTTEPPNHGGGIKFHENPDNSG